MPRMLPGSLRLLAVLLPLGLSACADTLTSKETASSTTLQRDYDKTLTKAEQKAVIDDMQSATAKKEGAEASDPTAAQSAEKQD
jgi:hypothetical protein